MIIFSLVTVFVCGMLNSAAPDDYTEKRSAQPVGTINFVQPKQNEIIYQAKNSTAPTTKELIEQNERQEVAMPTPTGICICSVKTDGTCYTISRISEGGGLVESKPLKNGELSYKKNDGSHVRYQLNPGECAVLDEHGNTCIAYLSTLQKNSFESFREWGNSWMNNNVFLQWISWIGCAEALSSIVYYASLKATPYVFLHISIGVASSIIANASYKDEKSRNDAIGTACLLGFLGLICSKAK